jgi:hypothetical protein
MRTLALVALLCATVASATATLFFTYFGLQLVYHAITFDGEGSLGHVGMYIAAGLYPLLAVLFGGVALLTWRAFRRRRAGPPPA